MFTTMALTTVDIIVQQRAVRKDFPECDCRACPEFDQYYCVCMGSAVGARLNGQLRPHSPLTRDEAEADNEQVNNKTIEYSIGLFDRQNHSIVHPTKAN